jgi:hypothetical protein
VLRQDKIAELAPMPARNNDGMTFGCRVAAIVGVTLPPTYTLNNKRGRKLLTLNGGHVGAVGVAAQRDDVGAGDAAHLHVVLAVADLYTQCKAIARASQRHQLDTPTHCTVQSQFPTWDRVISTRS